MKLRLVVEWVEGLKKFFFPLTLGSFYKDLGPGFQIDLQAPAWACLYSCGFLRLMIASYPMKRFLETETSCFHFQRRILDGSLGFAAGVSQHMVGGI